MASENFCHARNLDAPIPQSSQAQLPLKESDKWRRHCGCIRTSEKLKELLKVFPSAPPPTPALLVRDTQPPRGPLGINKFDQTCVAHSHVCSQPRDQRRLSLTQISDHGSKCTDVEKKLGQTTWNFVTDLVRLLQLSVTATALALYYLIYCYMQLVYYMLRSALYFHNADGPMKITIGVVTITSVIVAFNLIIRMERLIGISF